MRDIHPSVYLAPGAQVIGDVAIGEGSSLWSNAVVRGDLGHIHIGARTNVQDNAVIHGDVEHPAVLGDDVVVGHGAIVHGCTVGSRSLVGMGAIVLDGATIGSGCIIGAGALVTHDTNIPDNTMAFGSPARVVRATTPEERADVVANATLHVRLATEARERGE